MSERVRHKKRILNNKMLGWVAGKGGRFREMREKETEQEEVESMCHGNL